MTDKPHGGAIVADYLKAAGVTHLFTLCGGHISPILVDARKRGIDIVDVRHEASAVFAADAHARLTGNVGVAVVTAGPGVTNTITAVKNAQMAQSPVLLIGGATPTLLKNRGSLQDIDQMSLMRSLVKWRVSVKTLAQLRHAMENGLRIARAGVPGPVFIEAPIDLLYPRQLVHDMFAQQAGVNKMKGLMKPLVNVAMKAYLARQERQPSFSIRRDASRFYRPMDDWRSGGQAADAANQLARARKPMLILGSQVLVNRSPEEAEQLAQVISSLGVPTWTGGMARGLLGADHPLLFRHKRSQALKEADMVIVAGFPFDFRLGYGQGFHPQATVVAINLSPRDLTRNRRPTIPVRGHPGEFLRALNEQAREPKIDPWLATLREREQARETEIDTSAEENNADGVNPVAFFRALDRELQDDDILVADGGDFVATAAYTLRPRKPLSWLDPGVYGTLGVGGGFAVGAGCARPQSQTWLIYGDGSSAYSLAEFDTYVRKGMAPIAVVGTDASWGQIAREQEEMLGDNIGTYLRPTDYEKVAAGYGGKGIRVASTSAVPAALKRARKLAAEGTPVCINLHLAASEFRKGSISM